MSSWPPPPPSFERPSPGHPRDTDTRLALRTSAKAMLANSSSESAASRSSSDLSSIVFGSSNKCPPATSQPGVPQSVDPTSSPSTRASAVVKDIAKWATYQRPERLAPFRAISLEVFDKVSEVLEREHCKLRYNYDAKKAELVLRMRLRLHEYLSAEIHDLIVQKVRALVLSLETSQDRKLPHLSIKLDGVSRDIILDNRSTKYPDGCVRYPNIFLPTIVIEISSSRKGWDLPEAAEDYYHGSDHLVRTILTLHIKY